MVKIYIFFICSFLATGIQAQIAPIDTDRPDQTESVFLVPVNWLQFESGFNYQKNGSHHNEYLTPTLLSKYGLSKRIELRLITTLKTNSYLVIPNGTVTETGFDVTEVGAKIALFEEQKLLPKTSLIFHIGIPGLTSPKFKPDNPAPNFRFTMQNTLSKTISLGYNLGCEWDGFSDDPAYIYTLTLGYNLTSKWYSYIESFGSLKKQMAAQHSVDGGLAYLVSDNLRTDVSTGFGLTETAPQWYIAIGASVRFHLAK